MNFQSKDTSLITILSSEHGRLRREQRDIDKRDLRKALKYGTRQRAWGQRWLVEYDGITFITNDSMTKEVTAYPSPLPEMELEPEMVEQHTKATSLLHAKPGLSTSHTVIVIDNSGSMLSKKNNVLLYRDSQNAAFSMTALEFVAEQLFNQTAVNSDLVSLVKFSSRAKVEIDREPIDWIVYNKLLSHRNTDRFDDRKTAPSFDILCSQSNYLPALEQASKLLEMAHHENCASSLFFFSDGELTDSSSLMIASSEANKRVCDQIAKMVEKFGKSAFTVTICGLGDVDDDFTSLKDMAAAARKAGAKATFEFCQKTANSISSAVSSLVSSTTESRTALMEGRRHRLTQREDLRNEKETPVKFDWQYFWILDHYVYSPERKKFFSSHLLPFGSVQSDPREAWRREEDPPRYLAINRNYVGKGAERVAFRARLSDSDSVQGFAFDPMIAKETKNVERIDEKIAFHEGFAETQDLANYLASEFNKRLQGIPNFDPHVTPRIEFLRCSVLLLDDPDWPTGARGVLVEKMLNTERFPWTKWNDNNGMVDGVRVLMHLDVDFELKQLQKEKEHALGAITEEEEESDDDDDDDASLPDVEEPHFNQIDTDTAAGISASDYLQAFTHFTYRYTNGRVMVCDLQGIFNTDMVPPTLELTDPAIHYSSRKGRRMVFGRTDKGPSGMKSFFRTHKCTKICKYLRLSAKNSSWKKDWRNDPTRREQVGGTTSKTQWRRPQIIDN